MTKIHRSDCAIYNAPAYPPGPCDCGVTLETTAESRAKLRAWYEAYVENEPPYETRAALALLRDFDRLLASHKGEREDG